MKTQNTNALVQLSKTELVTLTQVVKETVATENHVILKTFSSADLWNIQRTRRSRVTRRHLA
jgi:hypothetical protein